MTTNPLALDDRVAIVTGGAQGIGQAIAALLLDRGARVVLFDRNAERLAEAARELGEPDRVIAYAGDVTSEADAEAAVAAATDTWGRLDILVNDAGIGGSTAPLWEIPVEEWRTVIDVNLTGMFIMCRAAVPAMLERGWGRIVNIASIAGKEGNPTSSHYSASKAGVIGMTKSLGKELATKGVLVNAIAPAVIETPLLTRDGVDEGFLESLLVKIPMHRMGTPDEVARLVGYLASDELTFSTGAVYDLSGGRATY